MENEEKIKEMEKIMNFDYNTLIRNAYQCKHYMELFNSSKYSTGIKVKFVFPFNVSFKLISSTSCLDTVSGILRAIYNDSKTKSDIESGVSINFINKHVDHSIVKDFPFRDCKFPVLKIQNQDGLYYCFNPLISRSEFFHGIGYGKDNTVSYAEKNEVYFKEKHFHEILRQCPPSMICQLIIMTIQINAKFVAKQKHWSIVTQNLTFGFEKEVDGSSNICCSIGLFHKIYLSAQQYQMILEVVEKLDDFSNEIVNGEIEKVRKRHENYQNELKRKHEKEVSELECRKKPRKE